MNSNRNPLLLSIPAFLVRVLMLSLHRQLIKRLQPPARPANVAKRRIQPNTFELQPCCDRRGLTDSAYLHEIIQIPLIIMSPVTGCFVRLANTPRMCALCVGLTRQDSGSGGRTSGARAEFGRHCCHYCFDHTWQVIGKFKPVIILLIPSTKLSLQVKHGLDPFKE